MHGLEELTVETSLFYFTIILNNHTTLLEWVVILLDAEVSHSTTKQACKNFLYAFKEGFIWTIVNNNNSADKSSFTSLILM